MRDVAGAIEWYQNHETAAQIGWDPDGMCLKICRTARDIPAVYPSALSAQQATPGSHRITKVEDIRKGMVVYYDQPGDSNPFGHIVTVVGRVKGSDPRSLGSLLVRTNSVRANEVVVVRGDYFPQHWGDPFVFAATWLNGQALTFPDGKPDAPEPPLSKKAPNLREAIGALQEAVAYHKKHGNDRLVRALRRDIAAIRQTIRDFS